MICEHFVWWNGKFLVIVEFIEKLGGNVGILDLWICILWGIRMNNDWIIVKCCAFKVYLSENWMGNLLLDLAGYCKSNSLKLWNFQA
jgi:hypothetical protein